MVLELCRKLGISPEAVATFGDMPNDVLMFEKSGFLRGYGQRLERGFRPAPAP